MTNKIPRVSVLMSAHNSEKYIAQAIESILNQTFTDFDFIIVNDGSTDTTAEIIQKYADADKRIVFVNNKKNHMIESLNQGLDLCRGEYIARMDSDDIALPERFAKQVEYMDAHLECGACGTWAKKFGPGINSEDYIKHHKVMRLMDFLVYGCCIVNPSAMIRRAILVDNNIKYEADFKFAEDYGFWTRVAKYTQVHNIPQVLLNYRWHGGNISVVHKTAQLECTERIRKSILTELLSSEKDIQKFLDMTREVNERFWLFGILPIVRRKQYSITKTKYYLFEKLPIIKEQDGKIYLFEKIKIGSIK